MEKDEVINKMENPEIEPEDSNEPFPQVEIEDAEDQE